MSICGSLNVQAIVFQTCMPSQRLTFPDEEFFMAIHDAGMFTVKESIASKYFRMSLNVTCVLVKLPRCSASRHVIAAVC